LIGLRFEIELTHQFPCGIRHGIHGYQQYGIGGVDVSRCDAVPLVPGFTHEPGGSLTEIVPDVL
jgi:hypothetical protein